MKANSITESTPSIKRVVNVNHMRFKSLNNNYEVIKPVSDLHKLNNSFKNPTSFLNHMNSLRNDDPFKMDLLRQPSELDLEENFSIQKRNPIFQCEEDIQSPNLNKSSSKIDENLNQNISKIEITYKKNNSNKEIIQNSIDKDLIENTKESNFLFKKNNVVNSDDSISNVVSDSGTHYFGDTFLDSLKERNLNKKIMSKSEIIRKFNDRKLEDLEDVEEDDKAKDGSFEKTNQENQDDAEDESFDNLSIFSSSVKTDLSLFKINERKNSQILNEAKDIKNEMNEQFLVLKLKTTDVLYNLIALNFFQKHWIAGCKNVSPSLNNKIHFGDEILSLNDYLINDKESFLLLSKNTIKPLIELKLKRLPYARVIYLTEINKNVKDLTMNQPESSYIEILQIEFGIKLKQNTAKIEKIYEDGLLYKNGLKYDANKVEYDIGISNNRILPDKDRLTKWVITEINGDFINYKSSAEEIFVRLSSNNTASIIVQPYDLVKGLYKEKNKFF